MTDSAEIAPGSTLQGGRYRLDRVLGTGGMASVWLAEDEHLQRPVAVKVMADTLAGDRGYVRRFEREARVAAGLSHPALVEIFDFSAEGERPFLVMEYVSGGSLAERMREDGKVPLPVDVLARDLLAALDHVHAAGIVHRDIKPANVLIDEDRCPRLTDFGIAHPDEATGLTVTGEVVGTLKYLAPEVAGGDSATPRSDLYSFGVLLRDCGPEDGGRIVEFVEQLTAGDPRRRPPSARAAGELLAESFSVGGTGDAAPNDLEGPRVVIGEDDVLLREGTARLLTEAGFDVVAQTGDAEDFLRRSLAHRPDVTVIDVQMPPGHGDDGLRAALELRRRLPGTGVLVLSQFYEEHYALELIAERAEGVGYLLKERVGDVEAFVDAVTRVAGGGSALDPAVVGRMLGRRRADRPLDRLSPREQDVLAAMAEGKSNQGIADSLFVTQAAVEKHITSIFDKLDLAPAGSGHRRVLAVLAYLRDSG